MVKRSSLKDDLTRCVAALGGVADWGNGELELVDPLALDGSLAEPHAAQAARRVLVAVGHRRPDGALSGVPVPAPSAVLYAYLGLARDLSAVLASEEAGGHVEDVLRRRMLDLSRRLTPVERAAAVPHLTELLLASVMVPPC